MKVWARGRTLLCVWIGGRGVPIRTGRVTVVMGHFYRVRCAGRSEKRPSQRRRKMTVMTSSSTILTSSSTIFCVTRRMCNYQPRSGHAPRRTLSSASASGSTHAKTINDENIISKTFSQIRKVRPRPCSRPRRGESLSSGRDGPDHAE